MIYTHRPYTSEDIKRWRGINWGGQDGCTGDGGEEEHGATNWNRQGTGPPVEANRGGVVGVRLMERVRGRKVPMDGRTLGTTGTWEQVEDGKRGQPDGGRQERLA